MGEIFKLKVEIEHRLNDLWDSVDTLGALILSKDIDDGEKGTTRESIASYSVGRFLSYVLKDLEDIAHNIGVINTFFNGTTLCENEKDAKFISEYDALHNNIIDMIEEHSRLITNIVDVFNPLSLEQLETPTRGLLNLLVFLNQALSYELEIINSLIDTLKEDEEKPKNKKVIK